MPDTISQHRCARLVIHLPPEGHTGAEWTLTAVETKRGVPSARMVDGGRIVDLPSSPSVQDIWNALSRLALSHLDT